MKLDAVVFIHAINENMGVRHHCGVFEIVGSIRGPDTSILGEIKLSVPAAFLQSIKANWNQPAIRITLEAMEVNSTPK